MHVVCSKETLSNNISIVSKAVSGRTKLPILSCILLLVSDGRFTMTANDLEMGIETAFIPAEVTEDGSVALEARMFADIIHRLPDDTVRIYTDRNNTTCIFSGESEFRIVGLSGNEFPSLPELEKDNPSIISSAQFKNMIRQTIFSVAVEDSNPVHTGELLEIHEGMFHMAALDGFRIAYSKSAINTGEMSISVVTPAKTLNEVSKILPSHDDASVCLYFTDKHIVFETETFTVVSRLLDGDFMKYQQAFTDDFTTFVTADRQKLLMSLDRVSIIAARETKKIPAELVIRNDSMIISSNTETGTVRDRLSTDVDGNSLTISFNPRYLTDALRAIHENYVTIQFSTPLNPCIIKGLDNPNTKYLILPRRTLNKDPHP